MTYRKTLTEEALAQIMRDCRTWDYREDFLATFMATPVEFFKFEHELAPKTRRVGGRAIQSLALLLLATVLVRKLSRGCR